MSNRQPSAYRSAAARAAALLLATTALLATPWLVTAEGRPVGSGRGIAVLPLLNRTGEAVPVGRVRDALVARLADRGIPILDGAVLGSFMRRHRLRYTGGISRETAHQLRSETGARAVLITSLDLYQAGDPPKVGLTSRLVSTGEVPRVLWMDSAVETGDESPGILGLGLISDPEVVLDHVITELMDSLTTTVLQAAGGELSQRGAGKTAKRFRPKVAYASPEGDPIRPPWGRIAVLPFANESTARYAGEMLGDQLVRHLAAAGGEVVEPGVVRQAMLETRQIQIEGPSIPQVDVLRASLSVTAVIYGEVTEYREAGPGKPEPAVGFSLRAIDTASQQVVWSSVSHTEGHDGVFFFDVGEIATAYQLASELAQAIVLAFRERGDLAPPTAGPLQETLAELVVVAGDPEEVSRRLDAATAARAELERQAAAARMEAEQARTRAGKLEQSLEQSQERISQLARALAENREAAQAAATRLTEAERREAMQSDSIEALEGLLAEARRRSEQAEDRIDGLEQKVRELETALAEATRPEAAEPVAAGPADDEAHRARVEAAVRGWAEAWAGQRVDDYLASYSAEFRPAGGLGLDSWQAQRRARLTGPSFIELALEALAVEVTGTDRALATFRQSYRSDSYADVVDKTLEMRRETNGWKIVSERVRPAAVGGRPPE